MEPVVQLSADHVTNVFVSENCRIVPLKDAFEFVTANILNVTGVGTVVIDLTTSLESSTKSEFRRATFPKRSAVRMLSPDFREIATLDTESTAAAVKPNG